MKILKISAVGAVALLLAFSALPAAAVPILPGQSLAVSGTSNPFSSATLLASTGALAFTSVAGAQDFAGTLTQDVYSIGGLIGFRYTISAGPNPPSLEAINRVTMSFFKGFTTDADFITGVGGPINVDRQASGNTVGFTWANGSGIAPGTTAPYLYILTNAVAYGVGGMTNFSNGGSATVTGMYQPLPVPEPMSLLLLGSGIVVMGMFWRKAKG